MSENKVRVYKEKNYSKYKELSINTVLFTIGSFGAKIILFLMVPLYTYVLSTQDYGVLDLISTTVQLLIPVISLNVQDAVLRFSLDNDYEAEDVITVGMKIIGFCSFGLFAALALLRLTGIVSFGSNYLIFLFFSFFAGVLNNNLTMYLKAKDKIKIITVFGIINTFITCTLNVLLLLVVKMGINGYMISAVAGTIIADLGMFLGGKVYKDLRFKVHKTEIIQSMVLYGAPLTVNSISWWINNASDRYILTFFCGTALNGIYAISYKIPSILSTLQSVFYNAWSVSAITEFDKDDTDGFIGNVYSVYSALCISACSFIMVINVPLAKFLYAKDFFQAWEYVPVLLVGTVISGLGLFLGCIFTAVKNTKAISSTTIIGAVINTLLNFILIPRFGAYGAAFATMIGYFSTWCMRLFASFKIIRMKVAWSLQILGLAIILTQCILASFNQSVLIQIPFFFVIIILMRKYLYKTISKFKSMIFAKRKK